MNNENNQNYQNNQQPMTDSNSQMYGAQQMDPNAQMYGTQQMDPNAQMYGAQQMNPNAQMYGTQQMDPNAQMYGAQQMDPNAQMYGAQQMNPNAQMYGAQQMNPNAQMYGGQQMNPNAQMYGGQQIDPNAQMYGGQQMDPNAQMYGAQQMDPNAQMYGAQQMMNPNQLTVAKQPSDEPDDAVENIKPKKSLPILPILLVLILGAAGFFGYKTFFNDKLVVETEIKSVLKATENGIDAILKNTTNIDSAKEIVGYSGTLTMNSNYVGEGIDLTKLQNYKFVYNGASDSTKNSSSFHGTLYNANGAIVDIKTLTTDGNAYLNLGDIFNKVIKVDAETSVINANVDKTAQLHALKTLLKKTEPILMEYLDDSKIEKTTEEATINNETKKYNKISYTFNVNETSKYLAEKYLKDDEIINALAVLLEEDRNGVKQKLEEIKTESKETDNVIVINAYKNTFSTKAAKVEIITYDNNNPIEQTKYDLTFDDNKINFVNYDSSNEEVFHGTITENEVKVIGKDNAYEFNIKADDKNISGSYTIQAQGTSMQASFNSVTEGLKVTTNLDFNITQESQTITFSINNEMNVTKDAKVEEIDISQATPFELLTPEEQQYISNQIYSKMNILYGDIMTYQYRMTNNINTNNNFNIFKK